MCAIVGSFSRSKLKELHKLNAYRGELSYSLTTFKPLQDRLQIQVLLQDKGKMPDNLIDDVPLGEGEYFISHTQAPTTSTTNIHPAGYGSFLLWHNGIVKQKEINADTWDTEWLLQRISDYGWSSLSRVDGTFACVMYDGTDLYFFRNEISPLFIDDDLNISSTKFENSRPVEPNKVHCVNLKTKSLNTIAYFDTMENPYYFAESE